MRVLIACEYSGTVRDAFRAAGHDAWSCDLLPTEADPRWHIQGDVLPCWAMAGTWRFVIRPALTWLSAGALVRGQTSRASRGT